MKALICRKLGDPTKPASEGGALAVEDVPNTNAKKLATSGVRVRVAAAALNFADMLMVQGLYQEKPTLPFIPGGEFAGEVIEVGDKVPPGLFKVGQRVAGMVIGGGAMAEEVVVPNAASGCFPVPPGVDLRQAAAFPVAYGTSHIALVHRARLQKGQTVLVRLSLPLRLVIRLKNYMDDTGFSSTGVLTAK
jgi:NADPH2:quinone reductase